MIKDNKVTALVPCLNEGKRIGSILSSLVTSPLIDEILVVDGGSEDDTLKVVGTFRNVKVIVSNLKKGKGNDVRYGLKFIKTPITFMCDVDVVGINQNDIERMIVPVKKGEVDVCLGIVFSGGKFIQFFRRFIMVLTGERVMKTELLKKAIDSPYADGWGIESYMNFYFRHHNIRVKKVDIFVKNVLHMEKVGFL